MSDPAQARELFDEAWANLAINNDLLNVGYIGLLAERRVKARRNSGDSSAALSAAEETLALLPNHSDVLLLAAFCHADLGDLPRSEELLELLLRQGDSPAAYAGMVGVGGPIALSYLGEVQARRGNVEQAISTWRRALAEYPENTQPAALLADKLMRTGTPAHDILGELEPSIARSLTRSGVLVAASLYEAGATSEAEALFDRILTVSPDHPVAKVGWVECALASGDLRAARERCGEEISGVTAMHLYRAACFCDLALRRHGADVVEQINKAQDQGVPREEGALYRAWEAALAGTPLPELDEASGRTAITLLETALKTKAHDAAEALVVLARHSDFEDRARREAIAVTFLRRGFPIMAAQEWLASMSEHGPDVDALWGLSQAQAVQGDLETAASLAADVLSADAEHAGALGLRARILEHQLVGS